MLISDCNIHDTIAVHLFQEWLVAHLKDKFSIAEKIYFSEDYKNLKTFITLCLHKQDFGTTAEWHFFATTPLEVALGKWMEHARYWKRGLAEGFFIWPVAIIFMSSLLEKHLRWEFQKHQTGPISSSSRGSLNKGPHSILNKLNHSLSLSLNENTISEEDRGVLQLFISNQLLEKYPRDAYKEVLQLLLLFVMIRCWWHSSCRSSNLSTWSLP